MVSHTVAHYRIGFAHNQHGEGQNTLSPQLCYHSQKHKKCLVIK